MRVPLGSLHNIPQDFPSTKADAFSKPVEHNSHFECSKKKKDQVSKDEKISPLLLNHILSHQKAKESPDAFDISIEINSIKEKGANIRDHETDQNIAALERYSWENICPDISVEYSDITFAANCCDSNVANQL